MRADPTGGMDPDNSGELLGRDTEPPVGPPSGPSIESVALLVSSMGPGPP